MAARPFPCLRNLLTALRADKTPARRYATHTAAEIKPPRIADFHPGNVYRRHRDQDHLKHIKVYPSPKNTSKSSPDALTAFTTSELSILDPRGARAKLFSKANPERARVGDILMFRTRTGDPFSGTCLNIRNAGLDTSVLLRNHLTRVGVEVWFKVFSPNVVGVEVVRRAQRRIRRARLYYLRQARHDPGSVEGVVSRYMKTKVGTRGKHSKSGRK